MTLFQTAPAVGYFFPIPMRGTLAIDPESGAPLAPEREYPYDGSFTRDDEGRYFHDPSSAVSARTPDRDPFAAWSEDREGALTTGELDSTSEALMAYFRRKAAAEDDRTPERRGDMAWAFKKLVAMREDRTIIDVFAWYAAAQYLHDQGWDVRWMRDHMIPRCPHCHSVCKPAVSGVRCASDPNGHGHVRDAIHERVAEIYEAAFGEQIDRVTAFDPPEVDTSHDPDAANA